jgi:putative Ca2+/H+ antiporter (TMEM165/GDT1 family)
MSAFWTIFGIIFVAELPDKTALASLLLASRLPAWPVFLGACLAFSLHAALSVGVGAALGQLPQHAVHIGAGILFLVLAVVMWLRKPNPHEVKSDKDASFWKTLWTAAAVIFVAEWGDLTQFAMATLTARYGSPWLVLSAGLLGLWSVTAVGVLVGSRLGKVVHPVWLQRIAAVVFAGVGIYMLCRQ